jgi:hypothetical protein
VYGKGNNLQRSNLETYLHHESFHFIDLNLVTTSCGSFAASGRIRYDFELLFRTKRQSVQNSSGSSNIIDLKNEGTVPVCQHVQAITPKKISWRSQFAGEDRSCC